MKVKDIILDTNILLYFTGGDSRVRRFFTDYNPIISFVSELEILSVPNISLKDQANIDLLLSGLTIVSYSERFKREVINIRKSKVLKLPDAIVAATAISLGVPLATADKAFKNIPNLDLIFLQPTDQ